MAEPATAAAAATHRAERLPPGHGPARAATATPATSSSSWRMLKSRKAAPGSRKVSGIASSAVVGGVMKGRLTR